MRTVFVNGTVVDAVGEKLVRSDFAVEGDRIVEIGESVATGEGDNVVDVTDKYLLPGFFNCHAHLGWDAKGIGDPGLQKQAEDPEELGSWRAAMNVRRSLAAGVTTVRDLGMNSTGPYAKRAIDEGLSPYLRLHIVGRALSMTGGHTWWCCREADGVDDCRKAVREQAKLGATWIKIMASHTLPQFTTEELGAIVDEAHQGGLRVTAHATFDRAIRRVVEAGVDSVEHGGSVSPETIEMMLEKGVWVVTTFSPIILQAEHGLEHGMSEADVKRRRDSMTDPTRFAGNKACAEAGVPIAFGTDAGSPLVPHDQVAPELQFMIQVGVCRDNWDALRSLTVRPARLLGLESDLGTLENGKMADVVVLNSDPSKAVSAVADIDRVFVKGRQAHPASLSDL
ncbi:MAG: amidohydrolase family protein [Candidatus Dormiibacterota bacterium]